MEQTKTIKEQIETLIGLQVIDAEIYSLLKEKAKKPMELEELDKKLQLKKDELVKLENELKSLQIKLRDKEVDLQAKEENVKKLQFQLYQIKTNKEYSAMLKEIEGLKADNSLLEEEIIRILDDIEEFKNRIIRIKEEFRSEEGIVTEEKNKIEERNTQIDARLKELGEKRNAITPQLERSVLARYERILKNRDGLALVSVENEACGGCHMNLPPQVINEVKMREEIIVCGSCSRILYIGEDVQLT